MVTATADRRPGASRQSDPSTGYGRIAGMQEAPAIDVVSMIASSRVVQHAAAPRASSPNGSSGPSRKASLPLLQTRLSMVPAGCSVNRSCKRLVAGAGGTKVSVLRQGTLLGKTSTLYFARPFYGEFYHYLCCWDGAGDCLQSPR